MLKQPEITIRFDGAAFYARMKYLAKLFHELSMSNTGFIARHFPSWVNYSKAKRQV
jgi:hypothetical protein